MKIKQLQDKLNQFQARMNSEELDDFLGLSPDQMHVLLYGQFDEIESILRFNDTFDQSLLETVPVVTKVRLLIKLIGEAGEAKATQNGYLPKKIVNALYDFDEWDSFTVPSEEYASSILALRHAVTNCGWLKKRNRKFSLTKKGQLIFEKGFTASDYIVLLKYWLKSYNWSFTDRHPQCAIIQQAGLFLLYILRKRAKELFPTASCAELFIKAFPMALESLPEETLFPTSLEERVANVIRLRFIERFASYFGLVEYIVDPKLSFLERDEKSEVKLTKLFDAALCWFSVQPQNSKQMFGEVGDDLLH